MALPLPPGRRAPVGGRRARSARRPRPGRRGHVAVGLLLAGVLAVLVGGCADQSLYPATLKEMPPKDPPPRVAPTDQTTPAPGDEGTPSPDGLQVTCAFADIGLPEAWEGQQLADGTWAFTLPGDTGGGVVKVGGTYFSGGDAQQDQGQLEALVRGKEGASAGVQLIGEDAVLARVPVKRGDEWRLAKFFPDERSQLLTITYAPAGKASDAKVEETAAVLHTAATKTQLDNPGECASAGG